MAMRWRKHGLLWGPEGSLPWARTHASCPTPLARRDGALRVFVQSRDATQVGRVGWIDLDPDDPRRVVGAAREPVLDIGAPGAFDDSGVAQTSALRLPDGRILLYYVGFELCVRVRYRLLTGLAVSEDDGDSFRRVRDTPILERAPGESLFRCGPCVLPDGDGFRMWYVAGSAWETVDGKPLPVYALRHARSADGVRWPAQGEPVMPLSRADEHGFGRPWVMPDARGGFAMHYSIRRRDLGAYRPGYARSADGLAWTRADDEVGLDVTPGAWDGRALCFVVEFEAGGRRWALYNGDDFGAAGVGLAERLEA